MLIMAPVILLIVLVGISMYIFASGPRLSKETDEIIEAVINNELPEVVGGNTGLVTSDGLKIWYERLSKPAIRSFATITVEQGCLIG